MLPGTGRRPIRGSSYPVDKSSENREVIVMLVLSRRLQEAVVIDGRIRVTVVKTGAGAVRLGIEAPDDVPVHREEIHQRITASEQRSTVYDWCRDWRRDTDRAT